MYVSSVSYCTCSCPEHAHCTEPSNTSSPFATSEGQATLHATLVQFLWGWRRNNAPAAYVSIQLNTTCVPRPAFDFQLPTLFHDAR